MFNWFINCVKIGEGNFFVFVVEVVRVRVILGEILEVIEKVVGRY